MGSHADEICRHTVIHRKSVARAKNQLPDERLVREISALFGILSEPTRVKILHILFRAEMCVCDLAAALGMHQPAVSQQLKILKQADIVTYRKEGKTTFYSLRFDQIRQLYGQGLDYLKVRLNKEYYAG